MSQNTNIPADTNATITGESLFSSSRRKMLLLTGASVFIVFWGTVGMMFFFTKMSAASIIALAVDQPRNLNYQAGATLAEAAAQRIEAFARSAKAGQAASLNLTLPEIRALLINRPEFKLCQGSLEPVKIDKEGLHCEFCLPLPERWGDAAKGRYLDGRTVFVPRIEHGSLFLKLGTVTVKSQPVEGLAVTALRETNLVSYVARPEHMPVFQRISKVELAEGSLTLFSSAAK
ncbi:MAG: hypothetical protein RL095_3394 [Verrucomicrobiota bacterium]|jgi:hypothetical protein